MVFYLRPPKSVIYKVVRTLGVVVLEIFYCLKTKCYALEICFKRETVMFFFVDCIRFRMPEKFKCLL